MENRTIRHLPFYSSRYSGFAVPSLLSMAHVDDTVFVEDIVDAEIFLSSHIHKTAIKNKKLTRLFIPLRIIIVFFSLFTRQWIHSALASAS